MLKELDTTVQLDKNEYQAVLPNLELKLAELQRRAREAQIPLLVVFEGVEAAGKGTLLNKLILPLDPRGFEVHNLVRSTKEERLRPFLWRFWVRTPARGRIALFEPSWYRRVLEESVKGKDVTAALEEIDGFERQLTDGGSVVVKFWLHISRKEQARRFRKLEKNRSTAWRVTSQDWKQNKRYDEWVKAADEVLGRASGHAPWTVVEATDEHFATVKIMETVIAALEKRIGELQSGRSNGKGVKSAAEPRKPRGNAKTRTSILDGVDLSVRLDRADYEKQLKKYQQRLRDVEYELHSKRVPMVLLYEGWDAAGKGGNIKRVTSHLDPRGYQVVPIAAPTDVERLHHYMWRFWNHIPKAGHITIFDRTWYGRVLVERVEGFCSPLDWNRAYQEINETERHLASYGTILVKFWIHLSPDEQLRRFKLREQTPHKRWKITEEDYRNREKWSSYREAVDEMLVKTSTSWAPWTVVESNCKLYARVKALKTIVAAAEKALQ